VQRHAARLKCALNVRLAQKTTLQRMSAANCDPDRGCLTFSLRMRAVWRHDVFMTRAIRQKNGMDTLYTLHTSTGSGDAVLTNEKLLRVASRGREVGY